MPVASISIGSHATSVGAVVDIPNRSACGRAGVSVHAVRMRECVACLVAHTLLRNKAFIHSTMFVSYQ